MMRFFADPVRRLFELSRRGDVVSIARDAVVAAFGPEHNRTVLSDPATFHNAAEAPMPLPGGSAAARLGEHNLTNLNGERHRSRRRLVMPAFERTAIAGYRDAIADEIERRLPRFRPGARVDVAAEMTDLACSVAMRCLFGLDGHDAGTLGRSCVAYLAYLVDPRAMLLPFDLPGTPYRKLLRVSDELEQRVRALVTARRGRPGDDVLSRLIAARDEDGTALGDVELIAQVCLFFVAGFETTANTLTWTLFLLAQHPETALDDDAALDRAIAESMRLLPAAPFLFLRRTTRSVQLGGRDLPADAIVIVNSLVTHRDPQRFPDPARFTPERWLALDPGPYEYLPFGAGPRRCIGAGFAAQVIRLVLRALLAQARPALDANTRVSRRVHGIVLGPKHALPMRFVEPGSRIAPSQVRGDIHELVALG